VFWAQLRRAQLIRFLIPIGGFFLVSVFSAGRQAAFQIFLVTAIVHFCFGSRSVRRIRSRGRVFMLALPALMIVYMGYVAINRNFTDVSVDHSEALSALFDFHTSSSLDWIGSIVGNDIKGAVVEGIVYFSSSLAYFSTFLTVPFPHHFYGVMSFPFFYRQIEPMTGLSVIGALTEKIQYMSAAGAFGFAWTTAISSYILDFGTVGAGIFLFLQGYYSQYAWRVATCGGNFQQIVISTMVILSAIYLPIFPASSDSNLFFLWFFCIMVLLWRKRQREAIAWKRQISATRQQALQKP